MRYHNLDIWIDNRNREGYPLRAASQVFGEARGLLSLDPHSDEISDELKWLEGRDIDRDFLIRFGMKLYDYLFMDKIAPLFHQCYGWTVAQEDMGVRLRLRIEPPEVAVLPWEFLYSPTHACFLGTSERYALVRYLEIHQRISSLEAPLPLRILVAIPETVEPYPALDTKSEKANLIDILDDLQDSVKVKFLEGKVTCTLVSDALMDERYHCFHFIGHGIFQGDRGSLLLNSEDGGVDYVDEERFASLFQNHSSMKLVVLNSCQGAEVSSIRPLVGMSPQLLKRGIPAVVAMQYGIYDEAAVLFAREFYRKLFKGWDRGRVDVAMAHARNRLASAFPEERDIGTPVLFMRSREGVLFNPVEGKLLKDIPISKRELDTADAVIETYGYNESIEEHPDDREELRRLKQRIKFRNYVLATAVVVFLVMFFLSWVRAFDFFTLDTRVETYTMWLGDPFTKKSFAEQIVMVAIEDESFDKTWREKHALLLDKLSRVGAKVIAFDIFFEEPSSFDDRLGREIKRATERGTTVIAGIRDIDGSKPKLVELFIDAGCEFGLACIGEKLGHARTATLAVIKAGGGEMYSLGLKAFEAYHGAEIEYVDSEAGHILLKDPFSRKPRKFKFSELIRIKRDQKGCPVIEQGDKTAQIFIDLSPVQVLRNPPHRYLYEEVIQSSDANELVQFKDKIVLVGVENRRDRFSVGRGQEDFRSGLELHADALNTMFKGTTIRPLGEGGQLFLMMVLGLLGAFVSCVPSRDSPLLKKSLLLFIPLAYLAITILIYVEYHILLNTLYHVGAFYITYFVARRIEIRRFS
jgi:CHASE2 domain-containing sensor protein